MLLPFIALNVALCISAFVFMLVKYQPLNWFWLLALVVSVFMGISIYVATAYLVTLYITSRQKPKPVKQQVTYHSDGSYTIYPEVQAYDSKAGKLAFRIVGGVIGGIVVSGGLLILGFIILIAVSVANGGLGSSGGGGKEF